MGGLEAKPVSLYSSEGAMTRVVKEGAGCAMRKVRREGTNREGADEESANEEGAGWTREARSSKPAEKLRQTI